MATITYTNVAGGQLSNNQPKVARGPETITRVWRLTPANGSSLSISYSAGDVILFPNIKIPHGATILEAKIAGNHVSTAALIGNLKVRYPDASMNAVITDIILGSATVSAVHRNWLDVANTSASYPYVVSASDDALNRYVIPLMVVDAATSQTLSMSMQFMIRYAMDE